MDIITYTFFDCGHLFFGWIEAAGSDGLDECVLVDKAYENENLWKIERGTKRASYLIAFHKKSSLDCSIGFDNILVMAHGLHEALLE
jgi:hypothetical protein